MFSSLLGDGRLWFQHAHSGVQTRANDELESPTLPMRYVRLSSVTLRKGTDMSSMSGMKANVHPSSCPQPRTRA